MGELRQRQEYHRDDKLRELANGQACQVAKVAGIELTFGTVYFHDPQTVVWAHSNLGDHGKGKSIKAHDCFGFLACDKCHYFVDQGKRLNLTQRRTIQRQAMELTRNYLILNRLIVGATRDDITDDLAWLAGWLTGRIRVAP
jgi:hypothetical protein